MLLCSSRFLVDPLTRYLGSEWPLEACTMEVSESLAYLLISAAKMEVSLLGFWVGMALLAPKPCSAFYFAAAPKLLLGLPVSAFLGAPCRV